MIKFIYIISGKTKKKTLLFNVRIPIYSTENPREIQKLQVGMTQSTTFEGGCVPAVVIFLVVPAILGFPSLSPASNSSVVPSLGSNLAAYGHSLPLVSSALPAALDVPSAPHPANTENHLTRLDSILF